MTRSFANLTRHVCAVAVLGALVPATAVAQYPTEPPPPAPLNALRFPDFQQALLDNGLELVLVEDHDLPIVSISLTIPTGAVNDPPGERGLATMVAELITKGTNSRSAEEIAAQIEGVGGSLTANAGNDFFTLSSTVLTDHVELALTLMSDVLMNATFPESELELARTRALSGLRLEMSDPAALASRYFARALYGEHPYGLRETEASLQAISSESVRRFADTQLKPGGSLLVIAGDMTLGDARRLSGRFFGDWSGAVPARSYGTPPTPDATEILLVHRPSSEQSNIIYGNLGLRPGSPEYYANRVATRVLGGGADARLFLILREQKGWTYGSYASLNRPYDMGTFRATAEVRTEVTDSALTELLHQLNRIRTEPIPDDELANATNYLTGVFPLSVQTPQQIARQVSTQKRLGLGEDYLERYRERIAAISAEDARRAVANLIRPDSAVIIVVGNGEQIYELLSAIVPVRIIDTEGNPLSPDELTPTATAITFDVQQIVPRRDSLAVMVQGNPFGGMVTEMTVEGDEVVYHSVTSIPLAGLNQETTVRMAAGSFALRSVEQAGQLQGQPVETHLTVENGRIRGIAQTPQAGGTAEETTVDTIFTEAMIGSEQIQALLPAMPLAEGASFTISVFDGDGATIKPYTFKVEAIEDVTVGAGTFEVFRVSMSGGDQQFVFYVSTESPRKIVKFEIVGQPVVFELVN